MAEWGAEMGVKSEGINIPGWLITAFLAGMGVLTAGIAVGQKLEKNESSFREIGLRLCRIEYAVKLQPWDTCGKVETHDSEP